MEEANKTRLLAEFGAYLDSQEIEPEEETRQTDLFSMFVELAALRTEVKTESRQFGNAMEQFKETQALLRNSHEQLNLELERNRNDLASLRRNLLRPLMLELLDLLDRLAAGQAALQSYRPIKGWFHIKSRKQDRLFIESIREGQGMSLRRLEETLARQRIRPMETLGRLVDPHTMSVVELDSRPDLENGIVTAELRKGYLWGEETLRLAEVKANKL
jgi:molecular chaperone GrpE